MSGNELLTMIYNSNIKFFKEWYPHYSNETVDEMAVKMTRGILNLLSHKDIENIMQQ